MKGKLFKNKEFKNRNTDDLLYYGFCVHQMKKLKDLNIKIAHFRQVL